MLNAARSVSYQEDELGDIVDGHALDRWRSARDFWFRMTIPTVLLAGLLVLVFSSVPLNVLPPALSITGLPF